jgi:hypothetical protein
MVPKKNIFKKILSSPDLKVFRSYKLLLDYLEYFSLFVLIVIYFFFSIILYYTLKKTTEKNIPVLLN